MKISGRMIIAVCAVATGFWGMSHVAALQDAIGEDAAAAIDNSDAERGDGAPIDVSRRWKRDQERRLNEMMESHLIENLSFPGDNPLSDILEQLSADLSKTQGERVRIYPDTPALESEGIASLQDVIIKDVELDRVPAGSALDLVLRQTDPPLTWRIGEGFLFITTRAFADTDENLILRSYDISGLRAIPKLTVAVSETTSGHGGGMGGGGGMFQFGDGKGLGYIGGGMGSGQPVQQTEPKTSGTGNVATAAEKMRPLTWEESLIVIVQDMTSLPCRWYNTDGEGGRMNVAGNRLLVLQTRTGHQLVIGVLEQLKIAAEDAARNSKSGHRAGSTGTSEFARRSSQDAERELNQMMHELPNPELAFPGEHPLQEILKQIESHLLESQGRPVLMITDFAALDEESIHSLEDVIVKDIQIPAGVMTVGSALDRIMTQTDPSLTWIAKDEVLLITTQSSADAEEHLTLRSYDISLLQTITQRPDSGWNAVSNGIFFSGGMGGGSTGQNQQNASATPQASHPAPAAQCDKPVSLEDSSLVMIVQELTGPPARWFDIDGEGGRMRVAGDRLLVRQSRAGHQQVVEVLLQLELAAEAEAASGLRDH
ncbi:MAG TPA: hypothetical protein PLR25_28685 [Planctomycetaceae bacterium]|nr:hypothetical protein [Planctomycetaceae bacterium]